MQLKFLPDARPILDRLGPQFFKEIPECPGVYLMRDAAQNVVYVGKAKNLKKRLNSYRVANSDRMTRRLLKLLHSVETIGFERCSTEQDALLREAELLISLKPKFNRAGVWLEKPSFIAVQLDCDGIKVKIIREVLAGWMNFGPHTKGVISFYQSFSVLSFIVMNPKSTFADLPIGWLQYPYPTEIMIQGDKNRCLRLFLHLLKCLQGEPDDFITYIREKMALRSLNRFDQLCLEDKLEALIKSASKINQRNKPADRGEEASGDPAQN